MGPDPGEIPAEATTPTAPAEAKDLMPAATKAKLPAVPTEDATARASATDPNGAEDPARDPAPEVPPGEIPASPAEAQVPVSA